MPPNRDSSSDVVSTNPGSNRPLEIAHVLFMDIVAYSLLQMDEQTRLIELLQQIVRDSDEVVSATKRRQLLRLPTGDGMALVFFGDAEAPARCALEISRALRESPNLKLRMGIHTGPVHRVADINATKNVAGGGINLAQRVMDCGDAGHILVSKSVADVLGQMTSWKAMLHDLGEVQVKHGMVVHLYNLYTGHAGNPQLPAKIQTARTQAALSKRKKAAQVVIGSALIASLTVGGFYLRSHRKRALTDKDTIVLSDFENKTGDPVFDETLKRGLAMALEQSPFLSILGESRRRDTLRLMGRPSDASVDVKTGLEICVRAGGSAVVSGSIAKLGDQYVLGLRAVNCQDEETLTQVQARAPSRENVLDSLDRAAAGLRKKLGESLMTIEKFGTPVSQASTSSLEALRVYSMAIQVQSANGDAEAIPLLKRAIELDPTFAMAYAALATSYFNLGEAGVASQYMQKAYELRERISEPERIKITAFYNDLVTGDLPKVLETYEWSAQEYPRSESAHINMAATYFALGQYGRALEEHLKAAALVPRDGVVYANLIGDYTMLNRLEEAKATYQAALSQKLDNAEARSNLYGVAFLEGDTTEMARQLTWASSKPRVEDSFFSLQAGTEAYFGHLEKARELSWRAGESAKQNDEKETAALYSADSALREAEFGNPSQARQQAAAALALATSPNVQALAALVFARSGDSTQARKLADQLEKRFPRNTLMALYLLPCIRASIEIESNNPSKAISFLHAASPYDLASPPAGPTLEPAYLRGQAYLLLREGDQAAVEFQKFLDHRGVAGSSPLAALAHLGIARATALRGDAARARAAYQDFFMVWKDADPNIPILKQARSEYAKIR